MRVPPKNLEPPLSRMMRGVEVAAIPGMPIVSDAVALTLPAVVYAPGVSRIACANLSDTAKSDVQVPAVDPEVMLGVLYMKSV